MNDIIAGLKGKLIVSCQALAGNPLRGPVFMSAMAKAAVQGGAAAIRANGAEDIRAIRKMVKVPIIGINKMPASDTVPYITPDFAMAKEIYEAGADIIALDATLRKRLDGASAASLIKRIKKELGVPVMADISTYEEGMCAVESGADMVATTLSGYTEYSPKSREPDMELVKQLAGSAGVPVIAEGRYTTPAQVKIAFEYGAYAVVVGKVITNPEFITRYFIT
ncbi:MAG: N-acetylmannosamine-6-phosphate 2-epimerase [Kiritimatiellae bacterium]|nr:N-acetylmannosamine-6-phosphate 2-epimerase [Verrucomicrobiota bacterium]MCG2678933.1 N-acetylmannosamine-6-phosphate 2-epimerase [Kiritimatiellia bacterium]